MSSVEHVRSGHGIDWSVGIVYCNRYDCPIYQKHMESDTFSTAQQPALRPWLTSPSSLY